MIRPSEVTVSTAEFEFSHGRKPKGVGVWAFAIGTRGAEMVFMPTSTFGVAAKKAREIAAANGWGTVFVGP